MYTYVKTRFYHSKFQYFPIDIYKKMRFCFCDCFTLDLDTGALYISFFASFKQLYIGSFHIFEVLILCVKSKKVYLFVNIEFFIHVRTYTKWHTFVARAVVSVLINRFSKFLFLDEVYMTCDNNLFHKLFEKSLPSK